jgi:hypothetical protein
MLTNDKLARTITSIVKKAQDNPGGGDSTDQSAFSNQQGRSSGYFWPAVGLGVLAAGGGLAATYKKWLPYVSRTAGSTWEGIKSLAQRFRPSARTAPAAASTVMQNAGSNEPGAPSLVQSEVQSASVRPLPAEPQTAVQTTPAVTNRPQPVQPGTISPVIQHPEYSPAGKYAIQSDLIDLYRRIAGYVTNGTFYDDTRFFGEIDSKTNRVLSAGAHTVYIENLKKLFGDPQIVKDQVAGRPAQLLAILATMDELPNRGDFSTMHGGKAKVAAYAPEHRYRLLSEIYYPVAYLETRIERQSLKNLFEKAMKEGRSLTFIGGKGGEFKVYTWQPDGKVTTQALSQADVSLLSNVLREHINSRLRATRRLLNYHQEVLNKPTPIKPGEEQERQEKTNNFNQAKDKILSYHERLENLDKTLAEGKFTDAGKELFSIAKELTKLQRELATSKTVISLMDSGRSLSDVRPPIHELAYLHIGEPVFKITDAKGKMRGLDGVLLPVVNYDANIFKHNTGIEKILIHRNHPNYLMHQEPRAIRFIKGLARAGRI